MRGNKIFIGRKVSSFFIVDIFLLIKKEQKILLLKKINLFEQFSGSTKLHTPHDGNDNSYRGNGRYIGDIFFIQG